MLLLVATANWGAARSQGPPISTQYEVVYPGIYLDRERTGLDKFYDLLASWERRGPVDIQALVHGRLPKDTPGIGPVLAVTEAMVRYDNQKYDPDNRVLSDAAYARSLGYRDIFPFLTFDALDDFFLAALPPEARDQFFPADLNHSVTSLEPVYPGDTLYMVQDSGRVTDVTPAEGSLLRSLAIEIRGSVYNQRGTKVTEVIFRVTRNIRFFKGGSRPDNVKVFDAPDWLHRTAHVYTDDDWSTLRRIWSQEQRQGALPLYWEDVKVGDQPTTTADGPIDESVAPAKPYGMGVGGNRTLRHDILDPRTFKAMVRGPTDGIYRLADRTAEFPVVPAATPAPEVGAPDTSTLHKLDTSGRAILINYMGRDFAIRHINNWMGDYGYLYNIRWSIMEPTAHAAFGRTVPDSPYAERFLQQVPFMRTRHVEVHGLTGDVAIVRSYVTGKWVRNGQYFVDLVWWVETIDGYLWEEGGATVRLPSRQRAH